MSNLDSGISSILALLLPWLLGCALLHFLLRGSQYNNRFIVVGYGYLIGIFLTTILIRALNAVSGALDFWPMATGIMGLTIVTCLLARRAPIGRLQSTTPRRLMSAWELCICIFLVALILLRQMGIFQELLLRPMYPWDAWMNWSPKAITWFYYGQLYEFVDGYSWLSQRTGDNLFTIGAWSYPEMVPLLQLWTMTGTQSAVSPLNLLPWQILTIAMSAAVYGHLKLAGASTVRCVLAAYVLLGVPYLNVHSILAGYADLWLCAFFSLSGFSFYEYSRTKDWRYLSIAVFLAIACTNIKTPGLIYCLILFAAMAASLVRVTRYPIMAFASLAGIIFACLAIGVDFLIPGVGRFSLSTSAIVVPYLGEYPLSFHPITSNFFRTFFVFINWNLVWPALCLAIVSTQTSRQRISHFSPDILAIILSLIFVILLFHFTNYYEHAESYTTLNRVLLYMVPLTVFFIFRTGVRTNNAP